MKQQSQMVSARKKKLSIKCPKIWSGRLPKGKGRWHGTSPLLTKPGQSHCSYHCWHTTPHPQGLCGMTWSAATWRMRDYFLQAVKNAWGTSEAFFRHIFSEKWAFLTPFMGHHHREVISTNVIQDYFISASPPVLTSPLVPQPNYT